MIGLSPLLYLYFAGSALILYVFQHILSVISGISDSLTCVRRALHSFTCGSLLIPRKEVIQPHLPIRLPCYDFTPIIGPTLDGWLLIGYLTGFGCYQLSWCDGRCVQGPGTYSPQYADLRLLAIPASCRRVAACNPNWDSVFGVCSGSLLCLPLLRAIVVRV